MEQKERIARIKEMEKYLDETSEAIRELSDALTKYEWVRDKYYKLQEYYDSELWMQDFEADEAGELPKDLKRGIALRVGGRRAGLKIRVWTREKPDYNSYSR